MVDTAAYTGIYGESEEFQRAREALKEDPTNAELLDAAIDAASSADANQRWSECAGSRFSAK